MSRYIDADALLESVLPIYKSASCRNRNVFSVAKQFFVAINNFPTVDVRENVKGGWISHIEDDGYIECPFCQHATNCDSTEEQRELHYCFYCGAELK